MSYLQGTCVYGDTCTRAVALQGHVVAEEQLRIPDSWLNELEIPESHPPQPSSSGQLEVDDSRSSITVRNESTALLVEVRAQLVSVQRLSGSCKKNPS